MKIDESNYETFRKVEKLTEVDYDINWEDAENINGTISVESLYYMVEDLIYELERQKEKYEELEEDLKENYEPKPFDPYEEYGINENDFH